jgi:hypothetical protein
MEEFTFLREMWHEFSHLVLPLRQSYSEGDMALSDIENLIYVYGTRIRMLKNRGALIFGADGSLSQMDKTDKLEEARVICYVKTVVWKHIRVDIYATI